MARPRFPGAGHRALEEVLTMYDFRDFAACRGMDPELFFPVGAPGAPAYDAAVARAKDVCAGCPVREACLEFALDAGIEFGVFGGADASEREALRRALPRTSVA
jgi:WhiB family redox-sensing transcriptional regulator